MKTILKNLGGIRLTTGRFFLRKATKALRDNFGFWIALFAIVFAMTSCSDDLDVQQSYPFTVDVIPYGDKIVKGQTMELRLEIKPEGNYSNPLYTIRYFQYDGQGTLKLVVGPGVVNKSTVLKKLKSGNRDIFKSYVSHCRYKGKKHKGLYTRRLTEFAALFIP